MRSISAMLLGMMLGSAVAARAAVSPDRLWQDVAETQLAASDPQRVLRPGAYRTLRLDTGALQARLRSAPRESAASATGAALVVTLPLPQGGFARFRVEESPILEDALAAQFPEIRTYRGQGLGDGTAVVPFRWPPAGFPALVRSAGGAAFIDPGIRGDTRHYVVYHKKDYRRRDTPDFRCRLTGDRVTTES